MSMKCGTIRGGRSLKLETFDARTLTTRHRHRSAPGGIANPRYPSRHSDQRHRRHSAGSEHELKRNYGEEDARSGSKPLLLGGVASRPASTGEILHRRFLEWKLSWFSRRWDILFLKLFTEQVVWVDISGFYLLLSAHAPNCGASRQVCSSRF